MKKSLILLLAVALSGSACTGYVSESTGPGPGYYGTDAAVVVTEDRPYYTHGPSYISRNATYRWVGGHYAYRHGQRVWIHGHYVAR